jgi:hypothetical protein
VRPRIDATPLSVAHHGGIDPRTLAPEGVQAATAQYEEVTRGLPGLDPPTLEVARLRNAFHQQCHL